jgi:hypothetical protein
MVSDVVVVQYAAAGVVAAGLLCVFSSSALFPTKVSIGEVSRRNPVPWSPRGFGGSGERGKSPVFGLMWGIIFSTQFAFSISTFVYALRQDEVVDDQSLFNQCACVAGSFLLASVWTPLFSEEKTWTFLLSSVLLVTTAILSTCGAVFSKPFFVEEWYTIFGGVATTFFAGWCLVAAGLSVGIVTRVNNHGLNAPERKDTPTNSFFPLVLSIVAAILAILFANPVLPVPLLLTLPFVPGITNQWRVWVPAIVCVVGIGVGGAMVLVYRASGYPF